MLQAQFEFKLQLNLEHLRHRVENGSSTSLVARPPTMFTPLFEKDLDTLAIREDSLINEVKPHLPDDFVSNDIIERDVVDYSCRDVTWSAILRKYLRTAIELMETLLFNNLPSWTMKDRRSLEEARRELDRILYLDNYRELKLTRGMIDEIDPEKRFVGPDGLSYLRWNGERKLTVDEYFAKSGMRPVRDSSNTIWNTMELPGLGTLEDYAQFNIPTLILLQRRIYPDGLGQEVSYQCSCNLCLRHILFEDRGIIKNDGR